MIADELVTRRCVIISSEVLATDRLGLAGKLQRVLNVTARRFDRGLGQILHDQLHWLDVPDRVLYKL